MIRTYALDLLPPGGMSLDLLGGGGGEILARLRRVRGRRRDRQPGWVARLAL